MSLIKTYPKKTKISVALNLPTRVQTVVPKNADEDGDFVHETDPRGDNVISGTVVDGTADTLTIEAVRHQSYHRYTVFASTIGYIYTKERTAEGKKRDKKSATRMRDAREGKKAGKKKKK